MVIIDREKCVGCGLCAEDCIGFKKLEFQNDEKVF